MPWTNQRAYPFNPDSVERNAPSGSGVYMLFNRNRCVYIGEGSDIKTQLQQHLKGDNLCIKAWRPQLFSFEFVPPERRAARHRALTQELKPQCSQ
jgi:predicted GIY-YIG superfamily endonuclease